MEKLEMFRWRGVFTLARGRFRPGRAAQRKQILPFLAFKHRGQND